MRSNHRMAAGDGGLGFPRASILREIVDEEGFQEETDFLLTGFNVKYG